MFTSKPFRLSEIAKRHVFRRKTLSLTLTWQASIRARFHSLLSTFAIAKIGRKKWRAMVVCSMVSFSINTNFNWILLLQVMNMRSMSSQRHPQSACTRTSMHGSNTCKPTSYVVLFKKKVISFPPCLQMVETCTHRNRSVRRRSKAGWMSMQPTRGLAQNTSTWLTASVAVVPNTDLCMPQLEDAGHWHGFVGGVVGP